MQRITVRIVAIIALILAALLILTRRTGESAEEKAETSTQGSATPASATTRPLYRGRPAPGSHRDSPQLIELKKRWLALKELDPHQGTEQSYTERNKLSEESARTLLCSEDAIELILFLREKNIDNVVESRIEDLFKSDLSEEARKSLVALPNKPSADGSNYRVQFSREAGEGCPPEEFPPFAAALADPACSQEATFGQYVALVETDPAGALKATMAQIAQGIQSSTHNGAITYVLRALPPETDFVQIESILPATETEEDFSPYRHFKTDLIREWSESDPRAAAAHIIEHPDRYPLMYIQTPVMEILSKDLATGIEWIQELPEGPYFDQAASVAITRLIDARKPQEAHLLASQIGDPELRRSLMKAALGPPPRYEEDHD